jgi:hypothetical protein
MKLKFDQKMNQSNMLFKQEQDAVETARRLAIENELVIFSTSQHDDADRSNSQLLDLLLDVNNSNQIPGHLRIDLSLEPPLTSAVPSLIYDSDSNNPFAAEAQAIHDQVRRELDARLQTKSTNKPTKSLASLMATVPHKPFEISTLLYDLASAFPGLEDPESITFNSERQKPLTYLSPDDTDEYLANIDISLNLPVASRLPLGPENRRFPPHLSDKDLQVKNPNSVYNWLRRHEPRIFLQDGEGSEGSKSASGKPGALRGAGKRTSIPAPSKPDAVEFVEEDGMGYDINLGGSTAKKDGKRKRASIDDAGYRPKGGASRPIKKKKKEWSGESTVSARSSSGGSKSKAKVEADIEMEETMTDSAAPGP